MEINVNNAIEIMWTFQELKARGYIEAVNGAIRGMDSIVIQRKHRIDKSIEQDVSSITLEDASDALRQFKLETQPEENRTLGTILRKPSFESG